MIAQRSQSRGSDERCSNEQHQRTVNSHDGQDCRKPTKRLRENERLVVGSSHAGRDFRVIRELVVVRHGREYRDHSRQRGCRGAVGGVQAGHEDGSDGGVRRYLLEIVDEHALHLPCQTWIAGFFVEVDDDLGGGYERRED